MAKKTKQEAQQERLSLAEKRNRQERRNKKSRKEREQEKRRKKQERDRRKQKNIPTTAQQSIPYIRMLQDGICQVTKTFFSKTIQFYDLSGTKPTSKLDCIILSICTLILLGEYCILGNNL